MADVASSSGRKELLTDAFSKCLAHGLRTPEMQTFQSYFPHQPEPVAEALLELYQQVLTHIHNNAQAEFHDICTEYDIDGRLEALDQQATATTASAAGAVAEAHAARPAEHARNTGSMPCSVSSVESSARAAALAAEVAHLQQALQQAETQQAILTDQLAQRRAAITKAAESIQGAVQTVTQVLGAGNGWGSTQASV